ncbi:hypothetical protein SETIT_5G277300v2 [Setaria italica]|uniref:Uncharacterized protein n=1 Tax=Setaria italica TaxID=4555 RepID=A0A368R9J5_SETIT|nr:hypothetical protein SETIT_5G277300v2 [Setaria italica]
MAVRRDGANLGETEVRICNAITFPLRVIVLTPTRNKRLVPSMFYDTSLSN